MYDLERKKKKGGRMNKNRNREFIGDRSCIPEFHDGFNSRLPGSKNLRLPRWHGTTWNDTLKVIGDDVKNMVLFVPLNIRREEVMSAQEQN